MLPPIRSNKCSKMLSRSALLGGIACVTLYLGACDITGDSWRDRGPVRISPPGNSQETPNEALANDTRLTPEPDTSSSGLNPKNLFGKDLRSNEERIDRLERAMQELRSDFDSVKPSIKRLMAIETDIQDLVSELQRLSNQPKGVAQSPMAIPPQREMMVATPMTAPPATTSKKSIQRKAPPPVTAGQASIYDVRIGEHPGKTRIVLDTNAKTGFSVDVDNNERIMVIDLPSAKWSAPASKNLNSKTLSSYRFEESGAGSLLVFQLKKNAQILSQSEIPGPNGAGRRIVIDLQ